MGFYEIFSEWKDRDFDSAFNGVTSDDVARTLQKERLLPADMLTLLSPAADVHLETMARKASDHALRHFGRTVLLFTPMYVSNYCANACVYCGFNVHNRIGRKHLSFEDIEREAKAIAENGLKHLLLLTGEARTKATPEYICECVRLLNRYFPSVSIEIYAMTQDEYASVVGAGGDGLTIYQETYDEGLYLDLHPSGPKRDFRFRLDAPERGCCAGMRSVNIGALLGLGDWRKDAFMTALHADWLQRSYPDVEISVSLPRMRPHAGEFQPQSIVSDREMVRIMLAMRLFMPRIGITVSTREPSSFRDNIVPLGVTKMSAGVTTRVGGHTEEEESTGQFDISDERSVQEMCEALRGLGYQPVFKDWEPIVDSAGAVA